MGLRISTDEKGVKIKRFDRQSAKGDGFATYAITLTKKALGGGYTYSNLDVKFKKGVELNDSAVIKFNDGDAFFTFDEYNGKKYLKLMVCNFEVMEEGTPTKTQQMVNSSDDFLNIPDSISEELPFA